MNALTYTVFVYGTLKRGFPNHHYMAGATFLTEALTVDAFPLVVGNTWFTPYLIPEKGKGHRVMGELWDVPAQIMPVLDELESTHLPNGYRRNLIPVLAARASEPVDAWTYFRERRHISVIHMNNLADYQDRRYVASEDRDV